MKSQRRLPAIPFVLTISVLACTALLAESSPAQNSVLTGRVHIVDTNTPVAGVSVVVYHLASEETFVSPATDGTGQFRLPGLPRGYVDLAVRTPEGLFVGNQVVNLSPTETTEISVGLAADRLASTGATSERFFAGTNESTAGEAQIGRNLDGGGAFWNRPGGVALMAGAGALSLLAIGGGNGSASPGGLLCDPSPSCYLLVSPSQPCCSTPN